MEAVAGEAPTPELAAKVLDSVDCLLNSLEDELLRKVARLRLEGYTNEQIAGRIGKSVATVERKLSLIRKQFAEELEQ